MEGLDKITARIVEDAKTAAGKIEADAKSKADVLLSEAETAAGELLEERRTQSEEDAKSLLSRGQSLVRSERRKITLRGRQSQIEGIIDAALNKLASDSAEIKLSRYVEMIESAGIKGGEIVLSSNDRELGSALLERLTGDFSLAEEPGDFRVGIIVKQDKIVDNLTYDLAVRNARNELTQYVAELLEDN
ncbi:MAG: hypothetical protein GX834_06765 [Clostridiaceae bacterium]|nr:hypothetical protein [Clostridiaceae bacterium]